jgi:hypothetical protein
MFTVYDGAVALLRKPKGVFVQASLYTHLRSGQTFVKAAGGYLRISAAPFGDYWTTSHPDYKVVELSGFDPRNLK